MKKIYILIFFLIGQFNRTNAQVENVIVEKYYISDAKDATDTVDNIAIAEGSTTYRIFIDLAPGSKIKNLFGDATHTFLLESDNIIYNNHDRPSANFGYLLNKSWFASNPSLALDSWLTIGLPAKNYIGVLKENDTDGSLLGGTKNNGGYSSIPGGILVNNDPAAGFPLTDRDGMLPYSTVLGTWFDNGIKDISGADTTVFGVQNTGKRFVSNNFILQQNSGVAGADALNHVLIAQITTKGQLKFELNVEVEEPATPTPKLVKYVAKLAPGDESNPNIKLSSALTYPLACGCTDKTFLEYNQKFACSNPDSCKNKIVFGCMDQLACNYDPKANFNIQSLCCYPGLCADRDIAQVCPSIVSPAEVEVYPNPASSGLNIVIPASQEDSYVSIYNAFGLVQFEKIIRSQPNINVVEKIDIGEYSQGMYYVKVSNGSKVVNKTFMKL